MQDPDISALLGRRLTFEEFLDEVPDGAHVEWVDGEIELMSPISNDHDRVTTFLVMTLGAWIEERSLGRLFKEPWLMKIGPDLPGRSPDVCFVARSHEARVQRNFLDGPADLAVEVVSPSSRTRDRLHKFAEYECGGVREYWVIDPERQEATFHVLGDDGRYAAIAPDAEGRVHSTVLDGLWLTIDWFWQPPPVLQVLRAWGLIAN